MRGNLSKLTVIMIDMALVAMPGLIACASAPTPILTPTHGLLLPDLKGEPPATIYIQKNPNSGERELWFSTTVINIGDGPLEMIGVYDDKVNKTRAIQRIKTEEGMFKERVVGHYVFHEGHRHWHFEDFAEIEIFSLDSAGAPAGLAATTGKTTFCMQDTVRLLSPPPNSPEDAVYIGCDPVIQGISMGWADIYDPTMGGQQLNIENLPDGRYMVRVTANPGGLIIEKDESNNSSSMYLEIRGARIIVSSPPSIGAPGTEKESYPAVFLSVR